LRATCIHRFAQSVKVLEDLPLLSYVFDLR
jgi:hypothetical protein